MSAEHTKELFKKEISDICVELDMIDYQAFPYWICKNIFNIDEHEIDEAISIGGSNDYGIDIFHIGTGSNENEKQIRIVQAKFSQGLQYSATREDIESFKETRKYLENCPPDANDSFKEKSREFKDAINSKSDVKIIMSFIVTGSLNNQAKETMGEWIDEKNDDSIEVIDLDKILSNIDIPDTPDIQLCFDDKTIRRIDSVTNKSSILGYINAGILIGAIKQYEKFVYLLNPRQELGKSTLTNKAILNTLSDDEKRKKFWKFNNGITATCDSIEQINDSTVLIKNLKIVNGRQTTYSLKKSAQPLEDVFVLLTIHEAVSKKEQYSISKATNTQNPIKPADLVTNSEILLNLVSKFELEFNEFYFERQTRGFKQEKRERRVNVTTRRVLEKSSSARAYCAYAIDPNTAMMSEKNLFSTSRKTVNFETIFADKSAKEIIIPHIFMKILEKVSADWRKEARELISDDPEIMRQSQIFNKRIVRYYVLYFINQTMSDIENEQKVIIENTIIEIFRNLKRTDEIPAILLNIVETVCNSFMLWFNSTATRFIDDEIDDDEVDDEPPTAYETMYALKKNGKRILPILKRERILRIKRDKEDIIRDQLEKISECRPQQN